MKTAILLSGHMRTFDQCLPTLHWHVFRHFPDADFYVSTVQDADADKLKLIAERYGADRLRGEEIVAQQPDCIAELRARGCKLPEWWTKGKPYTHEPHAISVHPQAVARQLWQLEQVWNLYAAANRPADVIIRCRPDLWFHSAACLTRSTCDFPTKYAHVPWWGKFGGVNDRFATLGHTAAEAYFTTYSQIHIHLSNGCHFHPESLIKASLESAGCEIHDDGRYEFSTLRADGKLREPEISATDLAHCALAR
jgi:hypothetical protein